MSERLYLTLIRHAKSSWQDAGVDDFHRPLNRRGLADSSWMPAQIARRVDMPEQIFCSAAVRAVQTCQALCDEYAIDATKVVVDAALYLAAAGEIMTYLGNNAGQARHVFVIAHNPGLTNLFNHLVDRPIDNLPTFAVAHLQLAAENWSAVGAHCASVEHLMLPKELS